MSIAFKNVLSVKIRCFFLDIKITPSVYFKGNFSLQSTNLLFDKFKIYKSKYDKEIRRVQRTGYAKY